MKTVAEFLAFAAEVLEVPVATLSLETTYASIPQWDSMAQLRLVMQLSSRFGVEIPFAEVTTVTSLWEFYRRLNALSPKKVIAVDLDNTLWDGVVGEDGVDALRPRTDLLASLASLKARGVLLVILSKNDEKDALAGLQQLAKAGLLSTDDFVAWRIDWNDKAENLRALAAELNLGTDAFVFVDDNPVERLQMAAKLPEVAVANFPPNLAAYFPERPLTAEDLHKTEEYRAEAQRHQCLKGVADTEIWTTLGIELDIHDLRADEVPRVAQLSQKANQFNVDPHRYTEDDVAALARTALVLTVHARDRFGDQGLVSYVVVRDGAVIDWVMSCRTMGRGIELRVFDALRRRLAAQGVRQLQARWRETGRNAPVKDLFDRLGFTRVSEADAQCTYCRNV